MFFSYELSAPATTFLPFDFMVMNNRLLQWIMRKAVLNRIKRQITCSNRWKDYKFLTDFVFAICCEIGERVKYEQICTIYMSLFSVLADLSNGIWQSMSLVEYKNISTENRPFSWKIQIFSNFSPWGEFKTLHFFEKL